MIYVLAALVPPLGLLLNGQPFSAIFNLFLIVVCLIFGLVFHVLLLVPSAHALIAVHMNGSSACIGRWLRRSAATGRHRVTRADAGFEAAAPLNRHGAMLSTTANPTDGRFEGDANGVANVSFHPEV